jgi:hypothetical protein
LTTSKTSTLSVEGYRSVFDKLSDINTNIATNITRIHGELESGKTAIGGAFDDTLAHEITDEVKTDIEKARRGIDAILDRALSALASMQSTVGTSFGDITSKDGRLSRKGSAR